MKIQELKELSVKELTEKLNEATEAYNKMKLNHAISPLENPAQIKAARRDIARMQTELSLRK
ncbi:MAG: 50S ribosomal protein L29 [Prevotella sp.]|nr:50S ribosomal protein L29 [Prevotella sp.]MCQ2243946.1 50S ribosomal protein L29 [Bacteroidaceae bacterium]MCQ2254462.1 50S ribosomal protein L29 [Bacteroidaceae bacterium]